MEVTVEKLVYGGYGLARHDGRVILIPFAAPGDRLRVVVVQEKKDVAIAHIEEIVQPSPVRTPPPCPHFQTCGSCQLLHLSYAAQREAKLSFIRESLSRLGGIQWPTEIPFHSGPELGYRLRAQLKLETDGATLHLGYYQPASHHLCEIDACPLLSPPLNEALRQLRRLPAQRFAGWPAIDILHGDDQKVISHPRVGLSTEGDTLLRVGRFAYRVDPQTFFQVNRFLLEEMLQMVVGREQGRCAVDLYSGVGFFAIPLADRFQRVIGVERSHRTLRCAVKNARQNRAARIQFVAVPVERWLAGRPQWPAEVDLAVVDPPRPGLSKKMIRALARRLRPERLTYVSCNPATLARDLKHLLAEGYRLSSLAAIDLFPQTFHIETVAKLRRY